MTNPLRLIELTQTCDMCPSQWEGITDDGRFVYVRYRHGDLAMGVGDSLDAAIDASWACEDLSGDGGDGNGYMHTAEMLRLTGLVYDGLVGVE